MSIGIFSLAPDFLVGCHKYCVFVGCDDNLVKNLFIFAIISKPDKQSARLLARFWIDPWEIFPHQSREIRDYAYAGAATKPAFTVLGIHDCSNAAPICPPLI